jgi:hypothetical protein
LYYRPLEAFINVFCVLFRKLFEVIWVNGRYRVQGRYVQGLGGGDVRETGTLEDPGIDGRMILKCILNR